MQITARNESRYSGIWPDGAPRNKAEADARLARYAEKRAEQETGT